MKKKIFIGLLTVVLLASSACSNSASTDFAQSENQEVEQQKDNNVEQKNENKEEQSGENSDEKSENTVSNEEKSIEIKIYVSNDDIIPLVFLLIFPFHNHTSRYIFRYYSSCSNHSIIPYNNSW